MNNYTNSKKMSFLVVMKNLITFSLEKDKPVNMLNVNFFGHAYGMWKYPGQGLNTCHRSDMSHRSDYADSYLTSQGNSSDTGFNTIQVYI